MRSNANLFSNMNLAGMGKCGISCECINSDSEFNAGISTFVLKFKNNSIIEELQRVIEERKGESQRAPIIAYETLHLPSRRAKNLEKIFNCQTTIFGIACFVVFFSSSLSYSSENMALCKSAGFLTTASLASKTSSLSSPTSSVLNASSCD